jgi:DNA-nicking Smr family endonuclease
MAKKPNVTEEDIATFRQAVAGTKPINNNKIPLSHPGIVIFQRLVNDPPESGWFNFSEDKYLPSIKGDTFVKFTQSGITHKTFRKLRKGQYTIDKILDLHGMSVKEAKIAVDSLLYKGLREKLRVILIIHGKGHCNQEPTLKNKLNHWLRETTAVLAFCSATAMHGGRGAIYVLLKRMTEENLFE